MDTSELGGTPGELNRIAEPDGPNEPDGLGSANQARRDRTSGTKGTVGVPAVGQRGGTQGRSSGGSLLGVLCNIYLVPRSVRGCRRGLGAHLELRAAERNRGGWLRTSSCHPE